MSRSRLLIAREVRGEDTLDEILRYMARKPGVSAVDTVRVGFEQARVLHDEMSHAGMCASCWDENPKKG